MPSCTIRSILIPVFTLVSIESFCQDDFGTWSGNISMERTIATEINRATISIQVTIVSNRAHGAITGYEDFIVNNKVVCKTEFSGSGPAELSNISINKEESLYSINAVSPRYTGVGTGSYCENPRSEGVMDIEVPDQPLPSNHNQLSGTYTNTNNHTKDNSGFTGTVTTTVSWHLTRQTGTAELIISPQNYDTWLPVPGQHENLPGSSMTVDLNVQGVNGTPLTVKVKKIELFLTNTSAEPGLTLNFPLQNAGTKPDIRFLPQNALLSPDFQSLEFSCEPCSSISAKLGAYDGGGFTTLTAFATLEDGTRIKGSLFVSGGPGEVPIPKRDPGSNIAVAWLHANGNPADNDDKDESKENTNHGDGLTAYEEYRGVITEGRYTRLDPRKKELGVWLKKADNSQFSTGMGWLETAGDIRIIRFYENEIAPDRKLNRNFKTSHSYDQFAVKLEKGSAGPAVVGENQPIGITDKYPFNTDRVLIATDTITRMFNRQSAVMRASNLRMPYTLSEQIASTVAHELAHSLHVNHHGLPSPAHFISVIPERSADVFNVFASDGSPISRRPYPLPGLIGTAGNDESGDITCFMCYANLYQWAYQYVNGEYNYYAVPPLAIGKNLCNNTIPAGSLNANGKFFGDARFPNCLSRLKFKP